MVWTCGINGSGGPSATATLDALPAAADAGAGDAGTPLPITGAATFVTTSEGIDLTVHVNGCADGRPYPLLLEDGPDCNGVAPQGPGLDGGNDGFAQLTCTGHSGVGTLWYTRLPSDPNPWTVGGASASDIVRRVVVVEDPVTMQPVACGPIVLVADAGAPPPPAGAFVPALGPLAQVAGMCEVPSFSSNPGCPDPAKVAACACTHCDLSACLNDCTDYVACLESEGGTCSSDCPTSPACSDCMSRTGQCLIGFCLDDVGCGQPTPGGPCTRLRACCATQGPRAQSCLNAVTLVEKLGGDPSCAGLMMDQDFLMNTAYDPPCDFDP
jgi:hypothetical protein